MHEKNEKRGREKPTQGWWWLFTGLGIHMHGSSFFIGFLGSIRAMDHTYKESGRRIIPLLSAPDCSCGIPSSSPSVKQLTLVSVVHISMQAMARLYDCTSSYKHQCAVA